MPLSSIGTFGTTTNLFLLLYSCLIHHHSELLEEEGEIALYSVAETVSKKFWYFISNSLSLSDWESSVFLFVRRRTE